MRREIDVGMRGQRLTRATKDFLRLLLVADAGADEKCQPSENWKSGYGHIFIAMCTAAKANERGDEIAKALPPVRLLQDTLLAYMVAKVLGGKNVHVKGAHRCSRRCERPPRGRESAHAETACSPRAALRARRGKTWA